jgi:hypothetical protein
MLLILLTGTMIFSSCDRRTTKRDALKASVAKFKSNIKSPHVAEYFPKSYAEVQTDTILSNGYRVSIKNFTNMNKLVALPKSVKINETTQFRQIDSEITVYKNDKLIFKNVFSNVFSEHFNKEKISLQDYLNNGISIDEMASLSQNKVVLITANTIPKNNQGTYYKLSIDEQGNSNIKKIEDVRT